MKRICLLLAVMSVMATCAQAQARDTLTIMFQNLLNFPTGGGGILSREDTFAITVQHVKPDLVMVCELNRTPGSPSDLLLTHAFNINGITYYQRATFVNNTSTTNDLQQIIFYNSNKLGIRSQTQLATDLRDINKYIMYYKDPNLALHHDTTFLDVYVSHLKASTGVTNENMRNFEVTVLRNHVNTNPTLRNAVFAADFNVQASTEACYQTITTTGTYPFQDPIASPGTWNNAFAFRTIHTQSTRTTLLGGDGSGGGLDDRFDQILTSSNVISGANRVRYVPGTYHAIGQDGNHFNADVNAAPNNGAVPQYVAHALYYMSDHLPVAMDLEFTMPVLVPVTVSAFAATEAATGSPAVAIAGKLEGLTADVSVTLQRATANGLFADVAPLHPDAAGEFDFLDPAGPGMHIYRLQMQDGDGNIALSREEMVWLETGYPWQALTHNVGLAVHLPAGAQFAGEIVVTDLQGRTLAHTQWAQGEAQPVMQVPLAQRSSGMVAVTLTNRDSGWHETKRCVLMRAW